MRVSPFLTIKGGSMELILGIAAILSKLKLKTLGNFIEPYPFNFIAMGY